MKITVEKEGKILNPESGSLLAFYISNMSMPDQVVDIRRATAIKRLGLTDGHDGYEISPENLKNVFIILCEMMREVNVV